VLQRSEGEFNRSTKTTTIRKKSEKKEEKSERSRTRGDEIRDDLVEGRGISGCNLITTLDEEIKI